MVDKLFKGAIALTVLTIWSGIVAAAATGSDKAFDLSPVLAGGRGILSWLVNSAKDSTKEESNPEPFVSLASRKGSIVGKAVESQLETAAKGVTDPRLSACPKGSVEDGRSREISLSVANSLKGVELSDLNDVQAALKGVNPSCVFKSGNTRTHRYLVEGFRFLDAQQEGDRPGVKIHFRNF